MGEKRKPADPKDFPKDLVEPRPAGEYPHTGYSHLRKPEKKTDRGITGPSESELEIDDKFNF